MLKGIIVLVAVLFISGCAERGYKLTVNHQKQTATAQYSIPVRNDIKHEYKNLEKMNQSVKRALHSAVQKKSLIKKPSKVIIQVPDIDDEGLIESNTQNLHFVRTNAIYQKFGNSELHGHVIYITKHGEEKRLNNTRIYLLPLNKKIEKWYNDAYLKNQIQTTHTVTVKYLNATYLNLNKNFSFHGIAEGDYIVIIVSDALTENNKKVYIAKKMKIEKRKKIMAVFSKKL